MNFEPFDAKNSEALFNQVRGKCMENLSSNEINEGRKTVGLAAPVRPGVWADLKKSLLPQKHETVTKLGHYDLVQVVTNNNGEPITHQAQDDEVPTYMVFTRAEFCQDFEQTKLTTFMLGDLVRDLTNKKEPAPIMVNPIKKNENFLCEEVLFAPIFDPLTKKLMITDPKEALALLAINPKDQERFGIEIIFHMVMGQELPEDRETRELILKDKIDQLNFMVSRVPIKRGSGSIYCVLLNLDNVMEEMAFIRNYQTFDSYADVIFVTSDLKLLTGNMESINYDGEKIDTIFGPIIEWQKKKHAAQPSWS